MKGFFTRVRPNITNPKNQKGKARYYKIAACLQLYPKHSKRKPFCHLVAHHLQFTRQSDSHHPQSPTVRVLVPKKRGLCYHTTIILANGALIRPQNYLQFG